MQNGHSLDWGLPPGPLSSAETQTCLTGLAGGRGQPLWKQWVLLEPVLPLVLGWKAWLCRVVMLCVGRVPLLRPQVLGQKQRQNAGVWRSSRSRWPLVSLSLGDSECRHSPSSSAGPGVRLRGPVWPSRLWPLSRTVSSLGAVGREEEPRVTRGATEPSAPAPCPSGACLDPGTPFSRSTPQSQNGATCRGHCGSGWGAGRLGSVPCCALPRAEPLPGPGEDADPTIGQAPRSARNPSAVGAVCIPRPSHVQLQRLRDGAQTPAQRCLSAFEPRTCLARLGPRELLPGSPLLPARVTCSLALGGQPHDVLGTRTNAAIT